MLDHIRNGARSWVVKIIFGVIILVFVFWGMGNMGGGSSYALVSVNGEDITLHAMAPRYQEAVEQLRRSDPKFSLDETNANEIKQAVLSRMVSERLTLQEAARLGLFVAPNEILQAISQIGAFQDDKGRFSPEQYTAFLASAKQSPGAFEENYRIMLLLDKFTRYIGMSAGISEQEARNDFNFMLEERTAEYVLFPVTDYKDKVTITEEETTAYYDTNKESFRKPLLADLEYLILSPLALAPAYPPSDAEIADHYAKNQARFTDPDKFQVRHIYLRCPPEGSDMEGGQALIDKAKATLAEVEKQLAAKADFAELARKYSDDKATADLGGMMPWLEKGQVGSPAFDEAAAALKNGEISKPVRTEYGFHVIKMEGRMAAAVRPLDAVRGEIATALGTDKATADFARVQNLADDGLNAGTPLADLAKSLNAKLAETGLVEMDAAVSKIGLQSESRKNLEEAVNSLLAFATPANGATTEATSVANAANTVRGANATATQGAATNVPGGMTIPVPLNVADGIALVRITEAVPSRIPTLEEKRADIVAALTGDKAAVLAKKAAEEALPSFTGTALPAAFAGKTAKTDKFNRVYPFFATLGNAPGLADALFSVKKEQWLPSVYTTGAGAVIARVDSVVPAADGEWEKIKPRMLESRLHERQSVAVRAYMQQVFATAKITEASNMQEQLNQLR